VGTKVTSVVQKWLQKLQLAYVYLTFVSSSQTKQQVGQHVVQYAGSATTLCVSFF